MNTINGALLIYLYIILTVLYHNYLFVIPVKDGCIATPLYNNLCKCIKYDRMPRLIFSPNHGYS